MSKLSKSEQNRWHSEGQKDGANNRYDKPAPTSIFSELLSSQSDLERYEEMNSRYDDGWKNGYKQR